MEVAGSSPVRSASPFESSRPVSNDGPLCFQGSGDEAWQFGKVAYGRIRLVGERLILQLHDLAEDGRPANHRLLSVCAEPYPHAPQIRYAFLNSRDRDRFTAAGLPESRSLLLPNPIRVPGPAGTTDSTHARVLYPVRGIRRKNLGEVFLLAALSPAGTRYATTLAPTQLRWMQYFDSWQDFARQSGLPVELAVVDRIRTDSGDSSYEAWLAESTHLLSTSVSEGFGLVFLEAIALGKPLFGRDLPQVTRDQETHGIKAGRFYQRLLVPSDWVDPTHLQRSLCLALKDRLEAYDHHPNHLGMDRLLETLHIEGHLDFGNLPEDLQRKVLLKQPGGSRSEKVLVEIAGEQLPAVGWLEEILAQRTPTASSSQLSHYSPEAHLARLTALQSELLSAQPEPPAFLERQRVLEQYLGAEDFHFLLT